MPPVLLFGCGVLCVWHVACTRVIFGSVLWCVKCMFDDSNDVPLQYVSSELWFDVSCAHCYSNPPLGMQGSTPHCLFFGCASPMQVLSMATGNLFRLARYPERLQVSVRVGCFSGAMPAASEIPCMRRTFCIPWIPGRHWAMSPPAITGHAPPCPAPSLHAAHMQRLSGDLGTC